MGLSAPRRYRFALTLVLVVGLLASLLVATLRVRKELGARRVEISMDYTDFSALAQSYGYNEANLLIALRRAGLTSLAVSEELGAGVDAGTDALLLSGPQLISQARLAPLGEPTLAALSKSGRLDARDLYLIVYNPAEIPRYVRAIGMNLGPHALHVARAANPAIFAFRSQVDYFNTLGLGLPQAPLLLAGRLGLLVDPRVQNDERFGAPQIDRIFASFAQGGKPATVIFSGQRNEVLGFPDHLTDTADAFKSSGLNFGTIEIYDKTLVQKGNDGLAQLVPNQTVRVEAISKTELDKLDFDTVVARYLLGVRERNVRVVYLRPFPHPYNGMSPEASNVEMVHQIAQGLRARGFKLGRATAVQPIPGGPLPIFLASLAVPAIFMLLLEAFGVRRPQLVYAVIAADIAFLALGYASHHDLLARKLLALAGGIMFAVMGVVAIPRSFTSDSPRELGALAARRAAHALRRNVLRPLRRARRRRPRQRPAPHGRNRPLHRRQAHPHPAASDRLRALHLHPPLRQRPPKSQVERRRPGPRLSDRRAGPPRRRRRRLRPTQRQPKRHHALRLRARAALESHRAPRRASPFQRIRRRLSADDAAPGSSPLAS